MRVSLNLASLKFPSDLLSVRNIHKLFIVLNLTSEVTSPELF